MSAFHILALCGSLHAQSSNLRLLQVAQKLAPPTLHITIYDGLGALPHFNPDLDGESVPASVAAFRAQLDAAAGILICTPESGHGLPGSFKNALDWTVSCGQWMEKPTLILKASRSRFAHDALVEILTTLMAKLETREILLSGNTLGTEAMLADPQIAGAMGAALDWLAHCG